MSNAVIQVDNLSKQYRLGQVGRKTLHDDVNRWLHKMVGKEDPYLKIGEENDRSIKGSSDYVWALRDINFEVKQGEVLGIIGRNGAGKSTLLKILSKVTAPTKGTVKIKGGIASLLEVGTGFHPDLSGRDNIFLNGAILGMTKKEVQTKFNAIVDFSGIERYIDTPVKRYSSGMYVRLAFAVAAHLEPDILIIDEVLAVGDVEFQKKCLGKMKDVSEKEGRTVLFVTHQMDAISRLCEKVIVLKNGNCFYKGDAKDAIKIYLEKGSNNAAITQWSKNMPGSSTVKLIEVRLIDEQEQLTDTVAIYQPFFIIVRFKILQDGTSVSAGINLFNEDGIHVFASHDIETAKAKNKFDKGIYEARVCIPANFLAEGMMNVSVGIMSYDPFVIHVHEKEVVVFSVIDNLLANSARGVFGGKFPGVVRPILSWQVQLCEELI